MVILNVFTQNLCVTCKSNLFSKATFFTFVFGIISVVLPFVLAFKSRGLWIKRDTFYEQPTVRFTGEYIFLATTNNLKRPVIICSTIPYYEEKLGTVDYCSMIKVHEVDKTFDGKNDELNLSLFVTLPIDTEITALHLIALIDYRLTTCPVQIQAAIIFQTFIPQSISKFLVMSELKIKQSSPLICHWKMINNYNNISLLHNTEKEISDVIKDYSRRNFSTILKNTFTYFLPEKTQHFNFEMTVQYPEDQFYYKTNLWQTLKWAWIQYFAIFVIVSWCVNKIKMYIFNKRLVLFYEDNPFKKKQ